jgi:nucleotide-binding universal stress UspA family protein
MADWKNICCAIDFSEPSQAAMREAAAITRRLAADLTLLHVFDARAVSPEILLSRFEQALPELEGNMRSWQEEAERITGRPVRTMILSGGAAPEILRLARESSFDLLVLTTHGRTGLARVVMGSVAERVVREADCSVLVVRSSPA